MSRRTMLGAAALLCAWTTPDAFAQSYPAKTVRVVVPTGPSGGADMQGRLMSKRLSETMGQAFFVDNRPGASGTIGAEVVSKSPPDGYTLLVTSSFIAISAAFYKLAYDPLKDLAAVSLIASAPQVLAVHPSVPARSVAELIAIAKKQPGRLNAGSSGSGSINHIALEMLRQHAGVDITHVPYKTGGASGSALMSGEVDLIFAGASQVLGMIRAGRVRAIAVTSPKPASVLPGVPTLAATYPGFVSANWYAMLAPARTPAAIIERLHAEIVNAVKTPEIRDFMTKEGAEPVANSPAEFSAYLRSEIERYRKIVEVGKLKVE